MSLIRKTNHWLPSIFDDMFEAEHIANSTNSRHIGLNIPAVNVKETDDAFFVEMAAPGMKKENFEIELNHEILTISSSINSEDENLDEKESFTRKEFSYSSFERSFTLPNSINGSKISANYVDGVLKINLPKREEDKVKPKRLIKIA